MNRALQLVWTVIQWILVAVLAFWLWLGFFWS